MRTDSYTVTTGLLILFGMFVIYTRLRGWIETNVPIYFYVIMVMYVNGHDSGIPALPIYIGLVLTLLLRFEFMNKAFSVVIRSAESCALAALIYCCWKSIYT